MDKLQRNSKSSGKIIMNSELLRQILNYNKDTGKWIWLVKNGTNNNIGDIAGTVNNDGYNIITYKRKKYKSSRLAFIYMGHEIPKIVDHINTIKTDDRWNNLRASTVQMNGANRKSRYKNMPKGITWNARRNKWVSQITVNNKLKYLGGYDCPAAASFVYQIEADKSFGKFARAF